MSNVSEIFEQYKATVENAFPSIFTKEDVFSILNAIQYQIVSNDAAEPAQSKNGLTIINIDDFASELADGIADLIDSEGTNMIDSYDFSLSGNEIEVDSVYFDSRSIKNFVKGNIKDGIETYIANTSI